MINSRDVKDLLPVVALKAVAFVAAVLDQLCNPDGIDYPRDEVGRAAILICGRKYCGCISRFSTVLVISSRRSAKVDLP